jgi:hypothetical protein
VAHADLAVSFASVGVLVGVTFKTRKCADSENGCGEQLWGDWLVLLLSGPISKRLREA